jgi:hypothetical protein
MASGKSSAENMVCELVTFREQYRAWLNACSGLCFELYK